MKGEIFFIMKKFISCLLFLCLLAGVSFADVAYNTSNGMLGVISVSATNENFVPVINYTDAGNDSLLATFADGTYANLLLLKRSYDTVNSLGDNALIFDTVDMTTPTYDFTLEGVYGSLKVGYSYNGKSVFVASQNGSTITEYEPSTFTYLNSYTTDISGTIDDMLVSRFYVYLMMTAFESDDERVLLRFDGQLREDTEAFAIFSLPEDSNCLAELGNLYIAIGHSTGIKSMYGNLVGDIVTTSEPVKAICRDAAENLTCYYITQSESNGIYTTSLWHYNEVNSNLLATVQSENEKCQLAYDNDYQIMSALMGEKIFIYSSTGDTLLASFDSETLGGIPVNISMSTVITSTKTESSSSSGCNITGAGLVLFILAALKFKKS